MQEQRIKNYKHAASCIYVKEYKGKLVFWDRKYFDEDWDCGLGSQTDGGKWWIPRYYIFDPDKNTFKTVELTDKCSMLFENGKIVCK